MKLTVQQLANLCMHAWEVEQLFGFTLKNRERFLELAQGLDANTLQHWLENLSLLLRTVSEIGCAEVEIKLEGKQPLIIPMMELDGEKSGKIE